MGDTQLKVHLARLVDLEYIEATRAGPATTYELVEHRYDTDRSGSKVDRSARDTDRSAQDGDRSAIGRFPGQSDSRVSSQLNGLDVDQCDESVGIGRMDDDKGLTLFSQLEDEESTEGADRSASDQLRVLGEDTSVAHVGA